MRSLVRCTPYCMLGAMVALSGCMEYTTHPAEFFTIEPGRLDSVAYYPKGDWSESTLMVRETAPKKIRAGEEFEYKIQVYNATDNVRLKNVWVRKYMDPNIKLISSTPRWKEVFELDELMDPVWPEIEEDLDRTDATRPEIKKQEPAYTGVSDSEHVPDVRWFIEELLPEKMVTITVRARALNESVVHGCVSADYEIAVCTQTKVVAPELHLTTELEREFTICSTDQTDITFHLSNRGSGTLNNVQVIANLPQGLEAENGKNTIRFTVDELAPGETETLAKTIRVRAPGQYAITANARGGRGLETDAADAFLHARKGNINIAVTGPRDSYVGLPVEYDIKVTNVGDAHVRDLRVENRIPQGMTYVDATHGGQLDGEEVVWHFDRLGAGETRHVSARFRGDDTAGVVRSVASAEAICTGEVTSIARTELEGVPAMLVEVVDTQDPNKIGQNETYEITVTNQGSAPENNVIVLCTLPEELQFVSADGPTATRSKYQNKSFAFAPLASLSPGQTATWEVDVRCVDTGDVRFKVEVDSDEHGKPVRETEATRVYQ